MLWGIPVLLFQKKNNHISNFWVRNSLGVFIFLFFAGLIVLSFITAWLCLLFPLNFFHLLLLSSILLLYLLLFRKKEVSQIFKTIKPKPPSLIELSFVIICLIIFIILGSLEPINSDTHIYHIQIIRWFNQYGTVPGIANLFPRFGLGSNWFSLIGIFRIPFFSHENFTYLNTTTVIWFFLWLFNNWKWHSNNYHENAASKILSLFYLLIILFCMFDWELFRDSANSTNYDFIVTALSITVISFLIESILLNEPRKKFSLLFVILCISIIPFKLSGVFILLPLLFYLSIYKKPEFWLQSFITGIIILTPLLIKNYIVTGYPLYPVAWSFSTPDWQVPEAMTNYLRKYIHVSNRFYNNYGLDFTKVSELINKSWINSWLSGILLQHKIIFAASLSSLFLFFFKKDLSIDYKKLRILFTLLLLMAAGWFFSAPSPRFGYGVLLILAFFPICFFAGSKFTSQLQKPIVVIAIFISCFYLYKKITPFIEQPNHLLYPFDLEQPSYNIINIKGMDFYLPEIANKGWMRKCFDTQLPCICQENKYLEPRGKTLKTGFRMNPKPDSTFISNYNY